MQYTYLLTDVDANFFRKLKQKGTRKHKLRVTFALADIKYGWKLKNGSFSVSIDFRLKLIFVRSKLSYPWALFCDSMPLVVRTCVKTTLTQHVAVYAREHIAKCGSRIFMKNAWPLIGFSYSCTPNRRKLVEKSRWARERSTSYRFDQLRAGHRSVRFG